MRKNLTKQERLRGKALIRKAFLSQTRVNITGAKLIYIANELEYNRVLFTFVRKYGNAVQRNRTRRVAKEIYRGMKNMLKPGNDIIIIFFPGNYNYSNRKEQLISLFSKSCLFREP